MPKKYQIFMNDIEVSECQELGETVEGYTCGIPQRIKFGKEFIYKHKLCSDNPFCLYKELHRAQAEIKRMERELLEYKRYKFLFDKISDEKVKLREEIQNLRHALNFLQDKTGEIYGE